MINVYKTDIEQLDFIQTHIQNDAKYPHSELAAEDYINVEHNKKYASSMVQSF